MESFLDESDDMKVEIEALELSEFFLDACKKDRQQDFRDFQHKREN